MELIEPTLTISTCVDTIPAMRLTQPALHREQPPLSENAPPRRARGRTTNTKTNIEEKNISRSGFPE